MSMVWLQIYLTRTNLLSIIDLYITDINFIFFKTLLFVMYFMHNQNGLVLFVNPPLLLLVGEQRFGMRTNC